MFDVSIVLMSRSDDFGLDMDARVDTLIGLWHVLAWCSVLMQSTHTTTTYEQPPSVGVSICRYIPIEVQNHSAHSS